MTVTMSDVAQLAGVSTSTVSHVINETRFVDPATIERVRNAIGELGYRHNHLARSVARGGRTQSIGIAMSARSNPYFGEVVSAIDAAATARGSTILIGETADDSEREVRLIENLLQRRVDGIILAPGPDAREVTLPLLAKAATPTVLVDRLYEDSPFDQIGTENVESLARLVDHLCRVHGHTRVGFISGLPGLGTTNERLDGYRRGITRNGRTFDPALLCDGGSAQEGGRSAAATLLDSADPPTAIIAGNNAMTVGALQTLAARGTRVPADVAVAGFDDFDWAALLASPLTAIAQDWQTIGTRAVEILMQRLDVSHGPLVSERVPTALVVRNSCGCTGPVQTVPIKIDRRRSRRPR